MGDNNQKPIQLPAATQPVQTQKPVPSAPAPVVAQQPAKPSQPVAKTPVPTPAQPQPAQVGAAAGATPPVTGNGPVSKRLSEFDIPKFVYSNYPQLIDLIIETKSMDDKEKQYWFHILPIMNQQQVGKLTTILNTEKEKLVAIDKQYNQKLGEIQSKRVSYWEEQSFKQKAQQLKTAEKGSEIEEQTKEAQLLQQLEQA